MTLLRQLRREKLNLLVGVLLLGALVGTSLVQDRSIKSAASIIDENWRGAYDLLVTPVGQDFGGAATEGLVEGNFVATGGRDAIPLHVLDRIRALSEVELAAPIGMVGVLRGVGNQPSIVVQDDPVAGVSDLDGPVLLRLTSTVNQTTPMGEQAVSAATGYAYLAPRHGPMDVDRTTAAGRPLPFSPLSTNLGYIVGVGILPDFASTVVAIDSVSEQELLGRADFLRPLTNLPENRTVGAGEMVKLVPESGFLTQAVRLDSAMDDPAERDRPVIPLLVNRHPLGPDTGLRLTIAVEQADEVPDWEPSSDGDDLAELVDGATFAPWRTIQSSIDDVMVPFSSPVLAYRWPGEEGPIDDHVLTTPSTRLEPTLIGRPTYRTSAHEVLGPAFTVQPQGIVGPNGLAGEVGFGFAADPDVGLVQSYRSLETASGPGLAAAYPAPVGLFDAGDIAVDSDDIAYVPFGAYDPALTRLVGKDGAAGVRVVPNLSGVDFITGLPGAFTDLAGGTALRGDTPIDAIRVRVSGVRAYTAEGQARIEGVAEQIAQLGVRVTVVAGSSPQPVSIYVPDRIVDPTGATSDLGWVRQDWTTLGATVQVSGALERGRILLTLAGLLAAGVAAITANLVSGRRRRREVRVLERVGWTRAEVRGHLVRRLLPAGVLVTLGCALTAVAGPRTPTTMTAVAVVAGCALASLIGGVWFSMRGANAPRVRTHRSRPLGSPLAIATRHIARAPGSAGCQVGALAVLGAATAATVAGVVAAREAAGATRLSVLVMDSSTLGLVLLGAVGAVSCLVVAVLARQTALAQRGRDRRVYAETGLPARVVRAIDTTETALLGGVACSGAAVGALALSGSIAPSVGAAVTGAAVAAVLVALVCIRALTGRGKERG